MHGGSEVSRFKSEFKVEPDLKGLSGEPSRGSRTWSLYLHGKRWAELIA